MFSLWYLVGWLLGTILVVRAWRANRRASLRHTLVWAAGAWLFWGIALAGATWPNGSLPVVRYVALCLTGCAGVAVLGARRPGAGPWNFVVAGLLALLLLPFAESAVTGKPLYLDGVRTVFLAATLAVGLLNYLPTRLGVAALLLALGCAVELVVLATPAHDLSVAYQRTEAWAAWPLLIPWVAFGLLRFAPPPASEFDLLWLDFRNRFGLVWAQRLREQFNNAALHAGWPVILRWQGLRLQPGVPLPEPALQDEIVATLRALMKRFSADPPLAA